MEFIVPAQPEDLLDEDKAPGGRAVVPKDLAELSKEDVSEYAEGARRQRTRMHAARAATKSLV